MMYESQPFQAGGRLVSDSKRRRLFYWLLVFLNPSRWFQRTYQARTAEVKPCPFCGHLPDVREALNHKGVWAVYCINFDGCVIRPGTPWFASKTGDNRLIAIQEWNRRA